MPRGTRKRGEFDFTIWYEDGSRLQWRSTRSQSDVEIAAAIRRYLLPVAERIDTRNKLPLPLPPTPETPKR